MNLGIKAVCNKSLLLVVSIVAEERNVNGEEYKCYIYTAALIDSNQRLSL